MTSTGPHSGSGSGRWAGAPARWLAEQAFGHRDRDILIGRLDPISRVVSFDRKQARDLVFAHPGGSAHPSGPDGHGVSECKLVGCHTLLLGRALLRAA